MARAAIELWFDFSCPYAYLASRRARHLPFPVDWRPMLLGGVFRGTGAGDGPMATLSAPKASHNVHDMYRWARVFDEPFALPAAHPMRTVRALRTLLALPAARWPAAIEAIYAAYWQRGEDVTRDETIADALRQAGLTEAEIGTAAARADDPAIKDALRARTEEAISLGIFGAPAWVARGDGAPRLIWGQDRLAWVEAMADGWSLAGPPPGGARPLAIAERARPGTTLDVYFDVASPFAYLGLSQLPALAAMGVTPRLVPILLGALFRELGQVDVPWFAMPPAKQRYVGAEMARWAAWWGVPYDHPRKFPQRTVTAQRLCLLAARAGFATGLAVAQTLGRAMWAEQADLEDDATLRALAERHGWPADWLAQTRAAETKAALVAHTAEARAAGVFGVPTFVVDGRHRFWGQDRLELVARALAGWQPPTPPGLAVAP